MNTKLFFLLVASAFLMGCNHNNTTDEASSPIESSDSSQFSSSDNVGNQQPMIVFKDTFYDAYWEEME